MLQNPSLLLAISVTCFVVGVAAENVAKGGEPVGPPAPLLPPSPELRLDVIVLSVISEKESLKYRPPP